jgi:hypothetical protein
VIGKVGTDIEDAKCCWLVCTALQQATPEQQDVIKVGWVCLGGWRAEVREGGTGWGVGCRGWCWGCTALQQASPEQQEVIKVRWVMVWRRWRGGAGGGERRAGGWVGGGGG